MKKEDLDTNIFVLLGNFGIDDTCTMLSSLFHCKDGTCPLVHYCDFNFRQKDKLFSCEEVIKNYLLNDMKGLKE